MDLSSYSDAEILAAAGAGGTNPVSSAILNQESGNNPGSPTSIDGAIGRGQILPATFAQYAKPGEKIENDADNLAVHNRIIEDLTQKTGGDPARIAVGYFSGPGNIAPPDSPTPWKKDHTDGNGKSVSSYVSDVLGRMPKQYADSGQVATDGKVDGNADLSKLSDQELLKAIGQSPDKKQNISKHESFISGAADTTAFGFGDEIMGGLTAPVEYAGGRALAALGAKFQPDKDLSKMSLSDIYEMEKKAYSDRNEESQKANPLTYLGGQLAGGLTTGAIGGTTKAGQAIGNIARDGLLPDATSAIGKLANFATKAVTGAGVGATSGALYGLGSGEDGNRLQNAEQSALYGAVAGGAAPAIGSALGGLAGGVGDVARGIAARSPEALQDIASAAKGSAAKIYDQMRQIGADFKQSATQGFLLPDIDKALSKLNFIPALNPKTTAIIDDLKLQASKGNLGLDQLDQYRRLLGRVGGSEDGVSATAARNAIDGFVNKANASHLASGSKDAIDLLNQGRKAYAQASKFEKVTDILQKAGGDPNKIRSAFTRFVNNDKNLRGFTDTEIQHLKSVASGGLSDSALKGLSAFGFDAKHILGPAVGNGLTTAALGGPAGLALAGIGTVARQARNLATRGQAEQLLKVLEGKSSGKSPLSALTKLSSPSSSGRIGASNLIQDKRG